MPNINAPLSPSNYSIRGEGSSAQTFSRSGIVSSYMLPNINRYGSIRFGPTLDRANDLLRFAAMMRHKDISYPLQPFPYNFELQGTFAKEPLNWHENPPANLQTGADAVDGILLREGFRGVSVNLVRPVGEIVFVAGDWVFIDGFARQIAFDVLGNGAEDMVFFFTFFNSELLDKEFTMRMRDKIAIAIAAESSDELEVTFDQEGRASFGFDWFESGPVI